MIDAELSLAAAAARICVEKKHWWSRDVQLTTDAWQHHSGVIAPELPEPAWLAVLVAVLAVQNLRSSRDIAAVSGFTGDIANAISERIAPMLRDIEAGRLALAPFVADTGKPLMK